MKVIHFDLIAMVAQPSDAAPFSEPVQIQIMQALQRLSPEHQKSVLDFAEFLAQTTERQFPEKNLWDALDQAAANIPPAERAKMPTDGSYQHDHYLYGTPKREQ